MTAALLSQVEHRACELCQTPINDQGLSLETNDRGWIHTLTGQYRCPPGTYTEADKGGAPAFAFPAPGDDALETARDEAYNVGYEIAQETLHTDDELAERVEEAETAAHNAGVAQGRADYSTELNGAITAALHRYRTGAALTGERLAVYEALNEALTEAWESVAL